MQWSQGLWPAGIPVFRGLKLVGVLLPRGSILTISGLTRVFKSIIAIPYIYTLYMYSAWPILFVWVAFLPFLLVNKLHVCAVFPCTLHTVSGADYNSTPLGASF